MDLLTIAFMTKNEEVILNHTLPNLVKANIPIVALDTGSTDNTINYLRENNVTVYEIDKWERDFSYARNYLLNKINSLWILFLDADEFIEIKSIKRIFEMIKKTNLTFFLMPIYQNKVNEFYTSTEKNFRIKLFKTDQGYKYVRPINEDLDILSNTIGPGNFLKDYNIFHWGNDDETYKERYINKIKNYIEIFKTVLKKPEFKRDAMLYFQLGRNYEFFGNKKEAHQCYSCAVRFVSKKDWIFKFKFIHALVYSFMGQLNYARMKKILFAAEKYYKTLNQPLYLVLGIVLLKERNLITAREVLLKSLNYKNEVEENFGSYVFETKGFQQYLFLGLIEEFLGNFNKAKEYYLKGSKIKKDAYILDLIERIEIKKKEVKNAH
ncbi:MAG: glycosyltransferase [Candidatus Margulisiibacteriota bacterium]|jgi:hypothetical protein